MALPTKANLQTLDYTWRGLPFAQVEAKALSTKTLDVTWRGLPFYAASGAVGGGLFRPSKLAGLGSGGAFFQNPLG